MTSDITGEQGRGKVTEVFGYKDKEFGLCLKGNMEQKCLRLKRDAVRYISICFTTPHYNNNIKKIDVENP